MRILMISIMLFCFVVSGAVFAQEKAPQPVQEVLVQANTATITAAIREVNQNQRKLTVAVGFALDNNTVITTQSGEKIRIGDLKPGSVVQITYSGTLDNLVIQNITVIEKGQ